MHVPLRAGDDRGVAVTDVLLDRHNGLLGLRTRRPRGGPVGRAAAGENKQEGCSHGEEQGIGQAKGVGHDGEFSKAALKRQLGFDVPSWSLSWS